MPAEKVGGRDQEPQAAVNADLLSGSFRVTAEKGVTVSGYEGTQKKGTKLELDGDAARALMNDGSIERA